MEKDKIIKDLQQITERCLADLKSRPLEELAALQVGKLAQLCVRIQAELEKPTSENEEDDLDKLWREVTTDLRNNKQGKRRTTNDD